MFEPNNGTKQAHRNYTFLIPVILLGTVLRLYKLGAQSLWYDETVSAFLASQTLTELIAHTARDIHPPGYYVLLHFWISVVGDSEFALAYFSFTFGVLLIPLTFLLARYLVSSTVAVWAALLVSLSPYNIWYSQEVRMYTLAAALGIISAFYALRALDDQTAGYLETRRFWAGYIIAAAVGLYVLYYFVFLLIILNIFFLIWILFPTVKVEQLKAFLMSNALALIIYLPWLPTAWRQATNPPVPAWRSPPSLWSAAVESWSALVLGQSVEPMLVWPILLLAVILGGLGLRHIKSLCGTSRAHLLLLIYTFGPLSLIYIFSFITPLYHVRYVFTYAPAFYILIGAGLIGLATYTRRWIARATLALIIAASLFSLYQLHFNPRYQADDFKAAVDFIQQRWQPGDVVLINAGYTYTAFIYYSSFPAVERQRLVPFPPKEYSDSLLLLQTGAVDGSARLGWNDARSDFYAMSTDDTINALAQLPKNYSRLWMLRAYDTVVDPTALIRTWLTKHTTPLEDQLFAGESNIRAQGFLLPTKIPATNRSISFEDGMVLADWQFPNHVWQAGQTIYVKFWWTTTMLPQADYKMSLKVWTPEGELAAQGQDEWPAGTLYRTTNWPVEQAVYHPTQLSLPSDLVSGQYWLNVELYHPETIQPLRRQDNGEVAVTLGPIIIR